MNEAAVLEVRPTEQSGLPIELPALELPVEDGIPLETNWHRIQMNLLIDSLYYHWRDRKDFFASGNMFIYFSLEQARQVIDEIARDIVPPPDRRAYRGPDFFVVKDVDGQRPRDCWIVWEEGGRYPNVIVELLSPSTASYDLGRKKDVYERTFRTPEYFCFNPDGAVLYGWRLVSGAYQELEPNEQGWLWSEELGLWLGTWQGELLRVNATWLRFYTREGQLVLTAAEAEARRAEAEARRAEAAEAEVQRLQALLAKHGLAPE